jgi:hypothetical protein
VQGAHVRPVETQASCSTRPRARARRAAQDGGDFAGAFWLCAQCARALAPLAGLRAAAELGATVAGLYEEGVTRLEAALTAVCADFRAPLYAAVLEGYVHLGNVGALGEEARPLRRRWPACRLRPGAALGARAAAACGSVCACRRS